MKTSGSIVDTSVWIDFFRGSPSVKELVQKALSRERVYMCGPVLFELLQGMKSAEEKALVKEALLSLPYIELRLEDWEDAALISRELRGRGITLPITDLLIGRLAKRHNLEVVSFDSHFDEIPKLAHRKL